MAKRLATAFAALCLVASATAVAIAVSDSGDRPVESSLGDPQRVGAAVRACHQRVEGFARITPNPRQDAVIGPIAFIGLPVAYRDFSTRPDPPRVPGSGHLTGMKSVLWVRAGKRVTLAVPKDQRSWMRLMYERPKRRGVHELTVQACRKLRSRRAQRQECGGASLDSLGYKACRRPYTEFNGMVGINFERAPQRGACAELIVSVKGRAPQRKRLFTTSLSDC